MNRTGCAIVIVLALLVAAASLVLYSGFVNGVQ